MAQLVAGGAQDGARDCVEGLGCVAQEGAVARVQGRQDAQRAVDDLRRQRAIAVGELAARELGVERAARERALLGHAKHDARRELTCVARRSVG